MSDGYASEFFGASIGDVIQSPVDKEAISNGAWMALDGRDSLLSILGSQLQGSWPAGKFTATVRTLAATPAVGVIAASPNYHVMSAAAGTTAIQYSTDGGATVLQTSVVTPASTQVNCLLFTTGASTPRWVFGCSGTTTCLVSTGDNPNSTLTACTGSFTTTLQYGLAHSPQLDLTLMIPNGSNASVYTMPGTTTTFTARATATTATRTGGCWDGTYFVCITSTEGLIQRSTTGTSGWADVYTNVPSGLNAIVSDGAGTIVASHGATWQGCVYVSKDSGATWRKVFISNEYAINTSTGGVVTSPTVSQLSFANGKFFLTLSGATVASATYISTTGQVWVYEPVGKRGIAMTVFTHVAWRNNIYLFINTTTGAFSATEDATQFRRPCSLRGFENTNFSGPQLNYQEYMKVK